MKVRSVEPAGKADVYNMEVAETHSFIVNGGIISHNCFDEMKYCFMDHPLPMVPKPKAKQAVYDPYSTHRRTQ